MNNDNKDNNRCSLSLQSSVEVGGVDTATNHQREHCRRRVRGALQKEQPLRKEQFGDKKGKHDADEENKQGVRRLRQLWW